MPVRKNRVHDSFQPPGAVADCDLQPIESAEFIRRLACRHHNRKSDYFAMYSSLLEGIVTDPGLMLVPFDDHMVHRGDGVFEVFRCVSGGLYNLKPHLDRLERSARAIKLTLPVDRDGLQELIITTVRAGRQRDATVRVNISRGPGGFGVDPTESLGPQVYIAAYRTPPPFMESHPGGARVITFSKPMRPSIMPVIKSCNYLFNALMKQEARAKGADFAIAHDQNGCLAEGATENAACVTRRGELLLPRNRYILKGTTVERAKVLARRLVRAGRLRSVRHADCKAAMIRRASEIILFGTTLPVSSVTRLDGRPVGNGRPGPVGKALLEAIEKDMRANPAMRTPVWR